MKKELIKFLFLLVFPGLLFVACDPEDEEEETPDTDVQAVVDNVKSEEAVSATFNTINHYGINEEGIKGLNADSVVVTIEPCVLCDSFPKTVTIDFGNGILGSDGVVRKGQIIAQFSNYWRPRQVDFAGSYVLVSFNNFYVNNVMRSGQMKATFNGENSYGGPSITNEAIDLKLTFSNGTETMVNGSRTFDWIDGYIDLNPDNDIFEVSGTMTGIDTKGHNYTSEIVADHPLRRDNTCEDVFTFTQGQLKITPEGRKGRTLDFGDGTCDNLIGVDIAGYQTQINAGL